MTNKLEKSFSLESKPPDLESRIRDFMLNEC